MRGIVEMFSTGDLHDVASVISAEYVDHQGLDGVELRGPEGFRCVVSAARSASSGLHVQTEDLIAEEDKVAARFHWHGMEGDRETIEIIRCRDGRAVEHWERRFCGRTKRDWPATAMSRGQTSGHGRIGRARRLPSSRSTE